VQSDPIYNWNTVGLFLINNTVEAGGGDVSICGMEAGVAGLGTFCDMYLF